LYVQDSQSIELNTNLVKSFDDFSHSVSMTLAYTRPGAEFRNGFYEEYKAQFDKDKENNTPCIGGPCEYNNIAGVNEQASLEFTQFIFSDTQGEKLYHRIVQSVNYNDSKQYGDLENELRYYFTPELSYYNNTFYNYDRNVISKTQNSLAYLSSEFIVNFSHLYEDQEEILDDNTRIRTRTSYITTDARYNYSKKWHYYAGYAYDIESSETKNRHLGLTLNKKCWGLDLKYVENIRPSLDASGNAAGIKDKVLYLVINLLPIGGVNVRYQKAQNK
ncbi:hypothetical protein JHD50_12270, partial [Sulfurimonas sp. MAG313]|nr:hypothetical protein [Sulfurimonas sp. MAG313]